MGPRSVEGEKTRLMRNQWPSQAPYPQQGAEQSEAPCCCARGPPGRIRLSWRSSVHAQHVFTLEKMGRIEVNILIGHLCTVHEHFYRTDLYSRYG
jgi:hypothetical protein